MSDDPLVLTVYERADRRGTFNVYHDDRYLFSSATPFVDAARVLCAQGFDRKRPIVMRRLGSDVDAMHGVLGHVAAVEVAGVGFRPARGPHVAPPVRPRRSPAITLPSTGNVATGEASI